MFIFKLKKYKGGNMSNFEKVGKFMRTFGQEVKNEAKFPDEKIIKLRYDLIAEELEEFKVAIKDMRVYGQQWNILGDILEINTRQGGDKIALPNMELVDRKSVLNKMFEFRYPRDRFTKVLPRDLLKDLKTSKKRKSHKHSLARLY